jgi:hypothetical protein
MLLLQQAGAVSSSTASTALGAGPWISVIVAGIGLVGVIVTNLTTWWKEANRDAKRLRLWSEAKQAIDFWDARLKLLQLTSPAEGKELQLIKTETMTEVEHIRVRLKDELDTCVAPFAQNKLSSAFKLLLIYPDIRSKDFITFWALRSYYWFLLVLTISQTPQNLFRLYSLFWSAATQEHLLLSLWYSIMAIGPPSTASVIFGIGAQKTTGRPP